VEEAAKSNYGIPDQLEEPNNKNLEGSVLHRETFTTNEASRATLV
jgi:hypothetical protein